MAKDKNAGKDIETILREALDVHPKQSEDRQKFLTRLMKAAKDEKVCTDDIWESIGVPAQEWVNSAIDAYDDEKALPDPAPKTASDGSPSKAKDQEKDMATKNAKAANGKAGGNKTDKKSGGGATKGAKAEARKGSGGGTKAAKAETKGPSKRRQIKAILVKKPSTPVDDLIAKFGGKGGLSELSITSMRSDTLDTLKVAAEAGFWKGPALPERGGARE